MAGDMYRRSFSALSVRVGNIRDGNAGKITLKGRRYVRGRGDIEFRYERKEISSTELFGIPVQDWYYFAGKDTEGVGLSGLFACGYTFQFNLKEECYKFAGEILESARNAGLELHYSCSAKNLEEYTGQDLGWLGIDGSEFTMHREFREEWKCMILQIRISVPLKEIWRRTHLLRSS